MSHGIERRHALSMSDSAWLLKLWCFYPLLVPLYFMGKTLTPGTQKLASGVPQVADYYLAGFMVLAFVRLPARLPRATLPIVAGATGFVIYGFFVNFAWANRLEDLSLLKSSLFYAYDLLLLITCLLLYEHFKDRFVMATLHAVIASVYIQVMLSPFSIDRGADRQALFFNDENQLGYYCLLAATVVASAGRRIRLPLIMRALFWTGLLYLIALSQCRAALLGLGVLAIIALLEHPVRLLLTLAGLGALFFVMSLEPSILGKAAERLVVTGEYDTPATRGYDRILHHPEHVLLGAGEGAYERFHSALYASEIHSNLGTLLFCYGIIGTAFLGAAFVWIVLANPRVALFLLPAFSYGMAHHGLRAAFFWLMFAVLSCLAVPSALPVTKTKTMEPAF